MLPENPTKILCRHVKQLRLNSESKKDLQVKLDVENLQRAR